MTDPRTVAPETTIRSQIVTAMLAALVAAPFDPEDLDKGSLFDIVKRGNLDDISARETPGCSLEEGAEQVTEYIYQHTDKKLRVFINFKVVRAQGIDPDPLINYYFGRIVQLFVTTDTHFAGLAMDIAEAGNSIQTNGSTDPEPGGTVYLDIDFRHARGDLFNT